MAEYEEVTIIIITFYLMADPRMSEENLLLSQSITYKLLFKNYFLLYYTILNLIYCVINTTNLNV